MHIKSPLPTSSRRVMVSVRLSDRISSLKSTPVYPVQLHESRKSPSALLYSPNGTPVKPVELLGVPDHTAIYDIYFKVSFLFKL